MFPCHCFTVKNICHGSTCQVTCIVHSFLLFPSSRSSSPCSSLNSSSQTSCCSHYHRRTKIPCMANQGPPQVMDCQSMGRTHLASHICLRSLIRTRFRLRNGSSIFHLFNCHEVLLTKVEKVWTTFQRRYFRRH